MRLSGPEPTWRFLLGIRDGEPAILGVVVGGIFPPELAPDARLVAEKWIPYLEPDFRKYCEAEVKREVQHMLYGDPTSKTIPRGIFQG